MNASFDLKFKMQFHILWMPDSPLSMYVKNVGKKPECSHNLYQIRPIKVASKLGKIGQRTSGWAIIFCVTG